MDTDESVYRPKRVLMSNTRKSPLHGEDVNSIAKARFQNASTNKRLKNTIVSAVA